MTTGRLAQIRAGLRAQADPERAAGMERYLKSAMPCWGVRVPVSRQIAVAAARDWPAGSPAELIADAERLWASATHREERYAAIALLGTPVTSGRLEALEPLRQMAADGAWWDLVDATVKPIGVIVRTHPAATAPTIRTWSTAADRWVRRLAILSQLGAKDHTDLALLRHVVERNIADSDFFVRKAIGWALRDYARHDPAWVLAFVQGHPLSPLSRREALKHLGEPTLSSPVRPRGSG